MTDVENMRADIAAGTPGPWLAEVNEKSACVTILGQRGDGNVRLSDGNGCLVVVNCAENPDVVMFSPMLSEQVANARRIARVPDLEAAYLAQNERIKALESAISAAERQVRNGRTMAAMHILQDARAALGETK